MNFVRGWGALGIVAFVAACGGEAGAPEEAAATEAALRLASDSWYVAVGRCNTGEGIDAFQVNVGATSSVCLSPAVAASSADSATRAAVPGVGDAGGTEMIRVESGSASVRQVFSVIAPPANPLVAPVGSLRFFQASASSCEENANFAFAPVNDAGFLDLRALRGWGERDVRVNYATYLPAGWTEERLRHEVLFEGATFRGTVERPTFDILHPFAERPLLVTVFDLLPAVRSADRCATR